MRDCRGSALIHVMVLAAAVGASGFYIMRLSSYVEAQIKMIQNKERYLRLHETLSSKLRDPLLCTAALSGKSLSGATGNNGKSILPFNLNLFGTNYTLQNNWRTPFANYLEDIRVELQATPVKTGLKRDLLATPTIDVYEGEILVKTTEGTPSLTIARNDYLRLKMYFYVNQVTSSLYSCFARESGAALCTFSGGIYNAYGTPSRPRCEPFSRCHVQGNGVVPDPANCTSPFSGIRLGPTQYFCQWCNRNI